MDEDSSLFCEILLHKETQGFYAQTLYLTIVRLNLRRFPEVH